MKIDIDEKTDSLSSIAIGFVVALSFLLTVIGVCVKDIHSQNDVVHSKTYEVVLDSPIISPVPLRKVLKVFRDAKKGDIINVHLSGPGGSVNTVYLLVNAVQSSKAYVRMIVEAPSYSGDAYLATVGNELVMRPYSYLMFHTSSAYGTECALAAGVDRTVSNTEHCQRDLDTHLALVEKFIDNIKILTDQEKRAIKSGHDIYITKEMYDERMKSK
jgi:ATP-dependent protease ClpP protease subunit